MGLDSVHLIMAFEDYFKVQFPDLEIEKVVTMQDAVDLTAKLLGVTAYERTLRAEMEARLRAALIAVGVDDSVIAPEAPILQLLSRDRVTEWQQLREELQLTVPMLIDPTQPQRGAIRKWFEELAQRTVAQTAYCSYSDFLEAICIANYKTLIDRNALRDTFEIYIAIGGITVDCLGIDVLEVRRDASFANDFGMD